jgi:hypothetical protein
MTRGGGLRSSYDLVNKKHNSVSVCVRAETRSVARRAAAQAGRSGPQPRIGRPPRKTGRPQFHKEVWRVRAATAKKAGGGRNAASEEIGGGPRWIAGQHQPLSVDMGTAEALTMARACRAWGSQWIPHVAYVTCVR